MRKLLSVSALASTALLAPMLSPASAASLNNNIAVGHVTYTRPGNVAAATNVGTSNQYFTPNAAHGPKLKPAVKKWVCGPIVNYDGTPHCHWVTH
ncbi:MAG TPA: hypothetical protein VKX28_12495 [Xanthobacteraceae bacterium]|nr:hypothetical protein [Xanthobacteraceae bacterium]